MARSPYICLPGARRFRGPVQVPLRDWPDFWPDGDGAWANCETCAFRGCGVFAFVVGERPRKLAYGLSGNAGAAFLGFATLASFGNVTLASFGNVTVATFGGVTAVTVRKPTAAICGRENGNRWTCDIGKLWTGDNAMPLKPDDFNLWECGSGSLSSCGIGYRWRSDNSNPWKHGNRNPWSGLAFDRSVGLHLIPVAERRFSFDSSGNQGGGP